MPDNIPNLSNSHELILDSYQCNDGPNEQFGCGPCDTECTTLGKRCGKEKGCYPGCYCKPGFARDENKRCIHIDKCHQFYRKYL